MRTRQLGLATGVAAIAMAVRLLLPCALGPSATALRHLSGTAIAQAQQRAALIVQLGDGSYVTHCVAFGEESITGLELLTRSGLPVSLWGGAVCRIQQQGCQYPAESCFCQCKGSSCQYWSYWHWRDATDSSPGQGSWAYAQIGSGDYRIQDGAVEAWLWGDAQNPPVTLSFAEICGSPAAAVTPAAPARQSGQGSVLAQYAVFAVMAIALVAGFWLLRGRRGA